MTLGLIGASSNPYAGAQQVQGIPAQTLQQVANPPMPNLVQNYYAGQQAAQQGQMNQQKMALNEQALQAGQMQQDQQYQAKRLNQFFLDSIAAYSLPPEQRNQLIDRFIVDYQKLDPQRVAKWQQMKSLPPEEQDKAFEIMMQQLGPKLGYGNKTGSAGTPAQIQTYEYLTQGMSDEDKEKARRVAAGLDPRAVTSPEIKGQQAFETEAGKLRAQKELKPEVEKAVEAAKLDAQRLADLAVEKRSNEATWNVYNTGMNNLAMSLAGTETGPFVGWIPAVTANQQIANGAVAAMAPVLKQMFRAAGEGIFTDKDQELLMNMVPSRKDLPETTEAKIRAIDAIVRAKLRMPAAVDGDEITEEDIQTTMRIHGMTREQVLEKLQGVR